MKLQHVRILLFSALATTLFSASIFAQPSLTCDPRILELGNPADSMDASTFALASLIVSGTSEAETEELYTRLIALSNELKKSLPAYASPRVKSEAILSLLYSKELFRYSEFQTRIHTALNTGDYNCVSSAVLFYFLAKAVNLEVEAVETPVHAFCTVMVEGKKIDVETTNPYGFDPGAKKELSDSTSRQKKYVLVPQTNYYERKPISERRLLALVYNNRISLLQRQRDYESAVNLALDAYILQGDKNLLKDFAECVINYAIQLSDSGKNAEGLEFIEKASAQWGDYDGYKDYIGISIGNTLNTLMEKNDYARAFTLLNAYASKIEQKDYADLSRILTLNSLWHTANTGTKDETLAKLSESRNMIDEREFEKLVVFTYAKESDKISQTGAWLEAVSVLDQGLRVFPAQQDLLRQRKVYRQNYAIEVHNTFTALYNEGNREGAKAVLTAGLKQIPESTLLQNDLTLVK